jgi:GT2 family glycosyltransferase
MDKTTQTVAAVVVTYNRIELLKKCIQSLREQTRKLDEIIVVNNSSTDGTLDWLNSQNDLTIITQPNSGSAGGQYTGIKTVYEKGYDWIWCLDHDIEVKNDALEKFYQSKSINDPNLGFLTSTIYHTDGALSFINLPYLDSELRIIQLFINDYDLPIISASFGSTMFPLNVVAKVGLPLSDFFIWGDDVEYTFRIIESGYKGYLVRASEAKHYQPENHKAPISTMELKSSKMRFAIRNTAYCLKLRNKIMKRPKIGILTSVLNFFIATLRSRFRFSKKIEIIRSFYTFKFVMQGLFFNPRRRIES